MQQHRRKIGAMHGCVVVCGESHRRAGRRMSVVPAGWRLETAMNPLILALSMVLAPMVFAVAAHAGAAPAQEDAELLKRGQELVTQECGRCHGIGRSDASRHPQAPPFRTLSKRYPIEALEEALGEGIISGHPDMPEFQFDNDDVGAIIAYLKSIQAKQ
jgi:cytochrome c